MALLKVMPGDIVAIPAKRGDEHGFVLSRVIVPISTRTIEVFNHFLTNFEITEAEISDLDLSVKSRLFDPVYASFDFTKFSGKIKWPILFSDPGYKEEQSKSSEIEFASHMYEDHGIYYKNEVEYREPPGVRRNLNDNMIYSNPQLMKRINFHLNGLLEVGEPLNTRRDREFIKRFGIDWILEHQESFIPIADEIAQKLKDAQASLKKKQKRLAGNHKA